ncbi:helix-turn-helix transcriptional regulator [Enterococcus ureasiticus]|uniref:helix-turn-helix transcriptional regulator n=1 Tax=Enterococcus ureasiticus TaxID=903984 RepID=UPI0009FE375F|nr:helix-turn-helix transcriptional regulator [Enterococcus ureasiticus]
MITEVKKKRHQLNLTQQELADRLYVTRQSISNWENRKSNPNSDILKMLNNIQMEYKNN